MEVSSLSRSRSLSGNRPLPPQTLRPLNSQPHHHFLFHRPLLPLDLRTHFPQSLLYLLHLTRLHHFYPVVHQQINLPRNAN